MDHITVSNELKYVYSSKSVVYDSPLGNADHRMITIVQTYPSTCQENFLTWHKLFDLRQSNLERLYCAAGLLDWLELCASDDVEIKCSLFDKMFHSLFTQHIPVRNVYTTASDRGWITPYVKSLINDRWRAYRSKDWPLYEHLKQKAKCEISKAKQRWSKKLKNSPSGIWRLVEAECCRRSPNGLEILVKEQESLMDFMKLLSTKISDDFSADPLIGDTCPLITDLADWTVCVTESQVHSLLCKLSIKRSPGFDGIPGKVYKFLADIIALPLASIFNDSLKQRIFPVTWKTGVMIPIPKSDPPRIEKLRMITLLPTPAKVLERIVLNNMMNQFETAFGIAQHGFRRRHSTTTALIDLTDHLTRYLDDRSLFGAVLLSFDLSRAFDTLEHPLLLKSLLNSGFPTGFVKWINSYLSCHSASLKLMGTLSAPFPIDLGIPQGSVLGPALFCAFMGDLMPLASATTITIYADDVHSALPLPTNDSNDIYQRVDGAVNQMKIWADERKLILNLSKSKMMLMTRKPVADPPTPFPLPLVNEVKVLGVFLNSCLNWNSHISYISTKASRRLFALRRLKPILRPDELHDVYCGLIRSILEYASPVFVGLNKKQEAKLQRLDNRAHRLIFNEHRGSERKRTCVCEKDWMRQRRQDQSLNLFKEIIETASHTLHLRLPKRRTNRFLLEYCRTSQRQLSFLPFCCLMWNASL